MWTCLDTQEHYIYIYKNTATRRIGEHDEKFGRERVALQLKIASIDSIVDVSECGIRMIAGAMIRDELERPQLVRWTLPPPLPVRFGCTRACSHPQRQDGAISGFAASSSIYLDRVRPRRPRRNGDARPSTLS